MKYIIPAVFLGCQLWLLWMVSNDPSFECGHPINKDQLPPTREELEQAALILVSAMKREDDYQTFISKLLHPNDQQNGGIEQVNKIGFTTPSKVIKGNESKKFHCDLQIRQPSQMLPSKVGNLATFVVFQVRIMFLFLLQ